MKTEREEEAKGIEGAQERIARLDEEYRARVEADFRERRLKPRKQHREHATGPVPRATEAQRARAAQKLIDAGLGHLLEKKR